MIHEEEEIVYFCHAQDCPEDRDVILTNKHQRNFEHELSKNELPKICDISFK